MAPTTEKIILDPSEVSTSRDAIDITPWIDHEGIDWGESTIDAFMAERHRGEVPVDFTVPNREIDIPLNFVRTIGGTTPVVARANIQAKVALFQREGGWIKRKVNFGGTVYADIVNASMSASSVSGVESSKDWDLEANVTLEVLPDFYEAERDLGDNTETTAAELIFTETGIDGDYPARCRIVVDDDQAIDQRGMLWGFRSRHYSSASTAALKYEAEALTAMDTATKPALAGASGGTVIRHGTVSTSWTPVMNTNLAAGTYLTHTGTYRLWGRCYSTSGTTVQSRAVWDVGDLVNPVQNDAIRMPGASNFFMVDYGEVRLDAPPVGTHRWQGQIHAKGKTGVENFSVDKLWLQPLDEGAGKLTAPLSVVQGLATYSARSEFNTESGALTGDSLAVGGAWTVVTNSDADDFSESSDTATRTAVSDAGTGAGFLVGRGITASTTNYTNIAAQIDFKQSAILNNCGVLARVVDSANYVAACIAPLGALGQTAFSVEQYVASSVTILARVPVIVLATDTYYTIRLMVTAGGAVIAELLPQGSTKPLATLTGLNSALGTGGTLATGRVGIVDYHAVATACTRTYDNFAAWVPTADAVMFASQSAQLTTDGIVREDSTGSSYGPVSIRTGDNPRLPVAGLEGRTTEVFIKASRGDLDQLADNHTASQYGDDISARVLYRPSWLHVPNT